MNKQHLINAVCCIEQCILASEKKFLFFIAGLGVQLVVNEFRSAVILKTLGPRQ